ncbi:MAG TPA: A/G-specific adenine glycosylase [Usitatibacter sp.]|nr:A/G-specific adenine glycosylase [Usitatibacter sp.]
MAPGFAARVVGWQRAHGRTNLPWQGTRDAYRVWLSEVMLQQTQVATVIPYYERFLARYPDVAALAAAPIDDVLALWSGLGYYARARNLHRAACEVAARFGGAFPRSFDDLLTLPGIGRSTAAAIAAFASGERRAILDGNVKRVLARHAGIGGDPGSTAVLARLWSEAEARTPAGDIEAYTQGMMDLGADVCSARKPACLACPVAGDCVARNEARIDELPGRRARREARRKQVGMLVVLARGEVLLEKRPPAGIWGGLWSLPEFPAGERPEGRLRSEWGIEAARAFALAPFEHAFTHFTLEVEPWRIEVASKPAAAFDRAATWLALDDLEGAALPSPVRRLLLSVR